MAEQNKVVDAQQVLGELGMPRAQRNDRSALCLLALLRAVMTRYLGEIAWETEVWVADAPSHLIHFDGARFLGPYE
jgi:hypothetical protein